MSSKLASNLKSLFVPESTRKYVVPQSWVKAAAEAGVNVKLDPKLYSSFLDPNDPVNADYELVTRGQVLESIGRFPFDKIEFNRLQVGQPLPPDKNGNVFSIPKKKLPVKLPENINLSCKGNPLDNADEWKKIIIDGKEYDKEEYKILIENAEFAKILEDYKIKFVGPSSKLIQLMGDKLQAK